MMKLKISDEFLRFVKKISVLILPMMMITPFLLFLLLSHEIFLNGLDTLMACHLDKRNCLIGLKYTNPESVQFKIKMTKEQRPEILAVGTSRIMQVRRSFFKETTSFYNAGGAIRRLPHIRKFLTRLPSDYSPKILMLSLDQRFFNQNWDDINPENLDYEEYFTMDYSNVMYVTSQVLKGFIPDLIDGRYDFKSFFSLSLLSENRRIGLSAHLDNSGFRNDGTYYYGYIIRDPESVLHADHKFKMSHDRITNALLGFQYSNDVHAKAIEELDAILSDCQKKNIHVVAYLPPYAHEVYQRMMSMGDKYGYMKKLFSTLKPLFDRKGYTLIDASDMANLGASDKEALDGFHGSEKSYLRLILKLASIDNKLKDVLMPFPYLEGKLKSAKGDLEVFPLQE
jgi:hypothetical protein